LSNPLLSIIVPCFNPPDGWFEKLESNAIFLKSNGVDFELILVNDGSTKPLPQNLQQKLDSVCKNIFISYEQNMGKGFAVRKGVEISIGEVIIYTDIDFPYRMEHVIDVLEKVQSGSNIVIGVRSKSYYTTLPAMRVVISKLLRFLISFMMQIPTDDTQCGLKGFDRKGKEIFLLGNINRYLFDMEFVKLAVRNNLKVETTIVYLREGVVMAQMPLSLLFKEALNFIRILFI